MGYTPFGRAKFPRPDSPGGRVLESIAKRHGRTVRQVILNFLTRLDGVFTIPKAGQPGTHAGERRRRGLGASPAKTSRRSIAPFPPPPATCRWRCSRHRSAPPHLLAPPAPPTSTVVFVRRSTNSTMPLASFLPTVMRYGMPIRSASLNFTPGRSSRSSSSASSPSAQALARRSSRAASFCVGVRIVGRRDHHMERRDRRRQHHAVLIVEQLDGAAQNALDADAVGAHDRRDFLAVGIQHAQAHRLRILVAELENVPDLDRLHHVERRAALRARIARGHLAQVAELGLEILARGDVAQVVIVRDWRRRSCCAGPPAPGRRGCVIFVTPTGPSEPASAPNHSRISSGCAWRNSAAPTLALNLVSLS